MPRTILAYLYMFIRWTVNTFAPFQFRWMFVWRRVKYATLGRRVSTCNALAPDSENIFRLPQLLTKVICFHHIVLLTNGIYPIAIANPTASILL